MYYTLFRVYFIHPTLLVHLACNSLTFHVYEGSPVESVIRETTEDRRAERRAREVEARAAEARLAEVQAARRQAAGRARSDRAGARAGSFGRISGASSICRQAATLGK